MSKPFYLLVMSMLALGAVFVLNIYTTSMNQPTAAFVLQSGSVITAILLLVLGALFFHARKK